MKTKVTIEMDASIVGRLEREAARQGKDMSEVVAAALRQVLPLPTFHSGGHLVDISDRNALYDVMEKDEDKKLY